MIYIQTDAPINPGQQRRGAGRYRGASGRHQHAHLLAVGRQRGHRLRRAEQHRPQRLRADSQDRPRAPRRHRRAHADDHAAPGRSAGRDRPMPGSCLSDVAPGGPAARAGLQPGDLVLALDGKRMENGRQLRINLYARGISDTVVDRRPARRSQAEREGARRRAGQRRRTAERPRRRNRCPSARWACSGSTSRPDRRAPAQSSPSEGRGRRQRHATGARTRSRAGCSPAT